MPAGIGTEFDMSSFSDRLRGASEATQSLVCVGLDVDPALMPVANPAEFNRAIVDATQDLVCAFKPNLAFYEALGLPGWKTLESTISHIRAVAPHCLIIGDAKRGDIGSTAEAYATAMFDVWGFDAVTVNPWGGIDTVEPWLNRLDRGVLVWCRGSNPGAYDLQELRVDGGEPVYVRLVRDLAHLPSRGNLGLVIGATAPEQLTWVRDILPDAPLLIPGVGAQGGDLAACVRNGVDASGRMAIINSGRAIIYASSCDEYADSAREAAGQLREDINFVLDHMGIGGC